jgi:hypothetical protein
MIRGKNIDFDIDSSIVEKKDSMHVVLSLGDKIGGFFSFYLGRL